MCVWYAECRVAVDLLERVSVWCWAGPPVCVCLVSCMFACVYVGECVVSGRSVCVCVLCVCLCVWCWAGPSVCVIRGMLSSCPSAGHSE